MVRSIKMALQSEFHKDLSKVEPIFWGGMTKPQLIVTLMFIPPAILILGEVFVIKGALFWIVAPLTAAIFMVPTVLKANGKMEAVKMNWFFDMKIQERPYQVGRIRKYTADEFIQKKEVKETDSFSD